MSPVAAGPDVVGAVLRAEAAALEEHRANRAAGHPCAGEWSCSHCQTVTDGPVIVCPPWCMVTREEHLADLPAWEGSVIHAGAGVQIADADLRLSRLAYIDGTPEPDMISGQANAVFLNGRDLTIDQAEALAHALLTMVSEARA